MSRFFFPDIEPVQIPNQFKPTLLVVIDTEEEFDWSAEFSSANTGTSAMRHIHRGQSLFDEFGIRPTYVIDYPVATNSEAIEGLGPIIADGRAELGAHLHPWVNPPFQEDTSRHNSYHGNLPADLEREKLGILLEASE